MKKIMTIFAVAMAALLTATSCSDMDDNYREYLDNVPTYSPAVRNLKGVSPEAGTITLSWEVVDVTNRIKSMIVRVKKTTADAEEYPINGVATEYTISGLELQGYDFDVFTVDQFGNRSIPVSHTFTPIPGRE